MKKSKKNNTPNIPTIGEVDKDLDEILKILEELDTAKLSIEADMSEISKIINSKLEGISKKYEPLINDLNEQKK